MKFHDNEYSITMIIEEVSDYGKFKYHWPSGSSGVTVILGLKDEVWEPVIVRFDKDIFQDQDTCEKWYEKHPIKYEVSDAMADCYEDATGVHIFTAGTAQSPEYDEDDLDTMIANFNSQDHDVPLVVGHADDNDLLEKSGLPAAGWISKLYRDGKKLFADLTDVPTLIADLIEKKALLKKSVEIYNDYPDGDGNTHGNLLWRVALLGADIPKIRSLDDHLALYEDKADVKKQIHKFDTTSLKPKEKSTVKTYTEAEVNAAKAAGSQEAIATFTEKHGVSPEEAITKYNEMKEEQKKVAVVQRQNGIKTFCEGLKKAGLAPVVVDRYAVIREQLEDENPIARFAEDGEEVSAGAFVDALMEDIAARAEAGTLYAEFSETAEGQHNQHSSELPEDPQEASKVIAAAAQKYSEENKVDLKTATIAVKKEMAAE